MGELTMDYRHHSATPAELAANSRWLPGLTDSEARLKAASIYMEADVADCDTKAEAKAKKYAAVYVEFPNAGPRSDGPQNYWSVSAKAREIAAAVAEEVSAARAGEWAGQVAYRVKNRIPELKTCRGNRAVKIALRYCGQPQAANGYHRENAGANAETFVRLVCESCGIDDSKLEYRSGMPRDARLSRIPKTAR